MATTRKRWLRIGVGGTLGLVLLLLLLHPYGRQMVSGPRVRGLPFSYWQNRYREAVAWSASENTLTSRMLTIVGITPNRGMDSFPVGEDMLPVVLSLVDDPSSAVRAQVAQSLSDYPDSADACNALRAMMNDDDPLCRVRAARVLLMATGHLDEAALAIMRTASLDTSDEYFSACLEAAFGLIVLAHEWPALVADVTTAFQHNPTIRRVSPGLLSSLGAAGAPLLAELLTDDDACVRERAAVVLCRIGPDAGAAVPALVNALGDPNPDVRLWARCALSAIDPERYPEKKDEP